MGLLWRTDCDRRPDPALDMLGRVHVLLLVHRVRVAGWLEIGHRKRDRPDDQGENPACAGDDGDQLVHLPGCLPLPDAWHHCLQCCGGHPDRLLRLGHNIQVWCRPRDLPGHIRQVEQGWGLASLSGLAAARACLAQLSWVAVAILFEVDMRPSAHGSFDHFEQASWQFSCCFSGYPWRPTCGRIVTLTWRR